MMDRLGLQPDIADALPFYEFHHYRTKLSEKLKRENEQQQEQNRQHEINRNRNRPATTPKMKAPSFKR